MYKISHVRELTELKDMPAEIISKVESIVKILDDNYGTERSLNSDGGIAIIIEPQDKISVLNEIGINIEKLCPEYTEIIRANDIDYIHSMILFSNEYSCHIFCEKSKATANLIDC